MKKIYYFIALIAITAFSACNPLDKTYKQLGDLPAPKASAASVTLTLAAADYGLLPKGHAAKTAFYFKSIDTAKVDIPLILASKYSTYGDKSSALVTYANPNLSIKPADSVYSHIYYVPTQDDYYSITTKYTDFSTAQAIAFLNLKYPAPNNNQLVVLNYTYYESGFTPSSGISNTIHSYLYLNGAWTKIYTISPAQYAAAFRGNYNEFVIADAPNLVNIFNTLLKTDPTVAGPVKTGDVIYVSYNYYQSTPTPATDYQRVQPLIYDGVNWVTKSLSSTLSFVKTNGTWVADNTVTYKLTAADYTFIKTTNVGVSTARDNVAQYGDFNISTPISATTGWSDADINSVIALILAHDYPNAVANQKFIITYAAYNGATISVTKTFVFNGTTFVVSQ